jgi:hypothetical protein
MNAVAGTVRKVAGAATRAATMTTEAAGAIGGAARNGVIGGLKGAASGAQRGLSTGSHSTPAAALTLGALGVTGLVEWPLLVAVGGTALVLKQLNGRSENGKAPQAAPAKAPAKTSAKAPTAAARPLKSVKSSKPTGSSATRRSPQAKKTTARQSRSGSSARARH